MKITEIIGSDKRTLSFEVFPPKNSNNYESIRSAIDKIARLHPSYMSVTYGAGGSTAQYTAQIASNLKSKDVEPLAHLTCVHMNKDNIHSTLDDFMNRGIENILALRGDIPDGMDKSTLEYAHASDLIADIKEYAADLCISGACYPEIHPESSSIEADVRALKMKQESGCEFLTTQLFFDNDVFYNYMYRLLKVGVSIPVIPGIMPITRVPQLKNVFKLSGSSYPLKFRKLVEAFGDDPEAMKQAGIAYATEQIVDLYANGFKAVHVYSMNMPDVASAIRDNLSYILS